MSGLHKNIPINDFLVDNEYNESRLIGRSAPHVEIVAQEWNPVFNAAAIHEEIQREPGMEPFFLLSLYNKTSVEVMEESWAAQPVKFVISHGEVGYKCQA